MARLVVLEETIARLSTQFGVSEPQLAHILGVQPRTIERWRSEIAFPQHESRVRLEQLSDLAERLDESFKTHAGAIEWLNAACGYFGGLKPFDALLSGRIDLVNAALDAMESGVFV